MQVYASLPDGGYTLTIQAQDGAGNLNGAPTTRTWSVAMSSYAQVRAQAAITLAAFTCAADCLFTVLAPSRADQVFLSK